MTESEPRRVGVSIELKPHAYDPVTNPELFEGVPARRVIAFVIDLVIIGAPALLVAVFILVFGILTFGLGLLLFWLWWPATIIWALVYYGLCFGSEYSATIGMRTMEIELRTWYGSPGYFLLGAVHGLVFWVTVGALTPIVLVVCLFNQRRRLLHDILVGTVIINNPARANALRIP